MSRAGWVVLAVLAAAAVWVRMAPTGPAYWHADPVSGAVADGAVRAGWRDARTALIVPGAPASALSALDAIAMATPRTVRLSGSPAEGRITWVTRSMVWGFPDVTTAGARAEGDATRLDLHARARFGLSDFGVNAARLRDWTGQLPR